MSAEVFFTYPRSGTIAPTYAQFCAWVDVREVQAITERRCTAETDEVVFHLRTHPSGPVDLRFVFAKDGTFLGVNDTGDTRHADRRADV